MDAAFLALETPELPMHVVGVLLLDPSAGDGYSADALRQVIADRLHLMPPFCRRLVDVPLSLDKPYWHYDSDIDLDRHVHTASLPAPGDLHALGSLVGEIASERLDRRLPLWELHIVDGLADGRAALIAKVHHSTLYGAAGAEFIAELLDLSPETRTVEPPAQGVASAPPGSLALARRTAGRQLRRPVELGQAGLSAVGGAVRMARDLTGVLSRHGRAALPSPAPRMPISGAATERRIAAFTALPLELTRATKDAAGVKLNDVVLAVVAMAVRRYLAARDITPGRDLVASVPL